MGFLSEKGLIFVTDRDLETIYDRANLSHVLQKIKIGFYLFMAELPSSYACTAVIIPVSEQYRIEQENVINRAQF